MLGPAAAEVGADGAGYGLEICLDVCCGTVCPLSGGRRSLTSAICSTLSLVGSVGETGLPSGTTKLIVPSAQWSTAIASFEELTVWHAGF